jgi:hypothetical protein
LERTCDKNNSQNKNSDENGEDDFNLFESEFSVKILRFAMSWHRQKTFLGIISRGKKRKLAPLPLLVENVETKNAHDENSRYLDLH